jgi:6-phosphogluconolactonase
MNYNGQNTGGHVELSPSNQWVYASNRGHNSIAAFSVSGDGSLTLIEQELTRGQTPRDFDIEASGKFLIAANQDSETLAVFRITDTGALEPVGDVIDGPPGPAAVQVVYVGE